MPESGGNPSGFSSNNPRWAGSQQPLKNRLHRFCHAKGVRVKVRQRDLGAHFAQSMGELRGSEVIAGGHRGLKFVATRATAMTCSSASPGYFLQSLERDRLVRRRPREAGRALPMRRGRGRRDSQRA